MKCELITKPLVDLKTEALVIPLLADVAPSRIRGLDRHLADLISKLNHHGDWRGEPNEVTVFYPAHTEGSLKEKDFPGIKRLVLVGMGKQAQWEYETMRRAVAAATAALKQRQLEEFTLLLPDNVTPATLKDLATIVLLASYAFTPYKTLDKPHETNLSRVGFQLSQSEEAAISSYERALQEGLIGGQTTNYVRDLVNHPANLMTPRHLAEDAQELAGEGVTVTVYGQKELAEMGMGALLAMAKGSAEEPKLIVVEYRPKSEEVRVKSQERKLPTIGLVGKGITFDSGGISIKPSDGMEEMKMDMAGAATCLGVIAAAKALALPVHLVAVLPVAENLPSGNAIKPGDIVTAYDGKTIEILNTDAEGRVVLADGLAYLAKNFQPDAMIDVATLTGAAIVTLGYEGTPMFGNDEALLEKFKQASLRTGERVWPMPLWEEYKQMTKSDVADVQNIGAGRRNAALPTAAAFLSYFVPPEIPWVHLDIAGPAMLDKPRPYYPKGGSGWGVRLLIDLVEHWEKNNTY